MLAYLKGTISTKEISGGPVDRLILDVAGVGFDLSVAHPTLLAIGQPGDFVTVHVAVAIRETEWTIFGFRDASERQLFGLLQSVTGIGPKLALALVGTLGVSTLVEAILSENQKMISQAPGVGAKVAQRIILELKTKIEEFARTSPAAGGIIEPTRSTQSQTFDEVSDYLMELGYTPTEIHMVFKSAKEDQADVDNTEELLRYALKRLGKAVKSAH
ncbi:MAG: Holliday junction branch migration protein RuvA [Cyanobacteria bacterium SZAS LIN-2]|nr:Holliday junction branch migration protein RuvA [Cyanobacteria bacterium SZAS LIN-3]MBS1996322.1 Holliday junction branch migration protein RuvA [Cyanobacteria bacterium SZAS LIN-2]